VTLQLGQSSHVKNILWIIRTLTSLWWENGRAVKNHCGLLTKYYTQGPQLCTKAPKKIRKRKVTNSQDWIFLFCFLEGGTPHARWRSSSVSRLNTALAWVILSSFLSPSHENLKLQGVTITQLKRKIAQQKALLQVKTYQLRRIKRRMVYRTKNKRYKIHNIASLKAKRNMEGGWFSLLSWRSSKSSGLV